ncbi:hypothetical protein ACMFMG_009029 [Clarireedia jacksonii]
MTIFNRLFGESKPDYKDAEVALAIAKRNPRAELAYRQKYQTTPESASVSVEATPDRRSSSEGDRLRKLVSEESIIWTTDDIRNDVQRAVGSETYTSLEYLALSDIGMGRYQWSLFVLCGSGWAADK